VLEETEMHTSNRGESSSMRTDGQTEMIRLIAALRNFAKASKSQPVNAYREIIAVCSQIHTKHINTLCGQNVELSNVKLAVHIVTTEL